MNELTDADVELLLSATAGPVGEDLDALAALLDDVRFLGSEAPPEPSAELAGFLATGTFQGPVSPRVHGAPAAPARASRARRAWAGVAAALVGALTAGVTGVLPAAAQGYFDRSTSWLPWHEEEELSVPTDEPSAGVVREPIRVSPGRVESLLDPETPLAAVADGTADTPQRSPKRSRPEATGKQPATASSPKDRAQPGDPDVATPGDERPGAVPAPAAPARPARPDAGHQGQGGQGSQGEDEDEDNDADDEGEDEDEAAPGSPDEDDDQDSSAEGKPDDDGEPDEPEEQESSHGDGDEDADPSEGDEQ